MEYDDTHSTGMALSALAHLWQISGDTQVVNPVSSIMNATPEEGEELLRTYLHEEDNQEQEKG